MYILVSVIHVIACLSLILVILLQAGRGGGLSEMFGGGGQQQKLFGTQTNVFMTKATTGCAVLFIVTSVVLGLMTTQRSRSLVSGKKLLAPVTERSAVPDAKTPMTQASPQEAQKSAGVPAEEPLATP